MLAALTQIFTDCIIGIRNGLCAVRRCCGRSALLLGCADGPCFTSSNEPRAHHKLSHLDPTCFTFCMINLHMNVMSLDTSRDQGFARVVQSCMRAAQCLRIHVFLIYISVQHLTNVICKSSCFHPLKPQLVESSVACRGKAPSVVHAAAHAARALLHRASVLISCASRCCPDMQANMWSAC